MNSVRFDDPYDHIYHTENTHEDNHPIDTQEQYMENNEVEQDKLYEDTNDDSKLENIHPDFNHNFHLQQWTHVSCQSTKNYPENIIDDPGDFSQYRIWILSGHKVKTLHPTTTKS